MKALLAMFAACGGGAGGVDASAGDAVPTDAMSVDAPRCFGAIESYCFAAPPTGTVVITDKLDTAADPRCDAGFADRCVIAGYDVVVSGFVGVSGARPLVLVAARSLQVDGVLGATILDNPACPPLGSVSSFGGGAGGSFVTAGGRGGEGLIGNGQAPGPVVAPSMLRAGCPGGGSGGAAGNAIALVAGERLAVLATSVVAACGEGGNGGGGTSQARPGGGGGAGGMIELDAPALAIAGAVLAIGGGGGAGSNTDASGQNGVTGCTSATAITPAGGTGASKGGNGATGGDGGIGASGTSGGGGGGGAGAIWIHGQLTGMMPTIVPSPTTH